MVARREQTEALIISKQILRSLQEQRAGCYEEHKNSKAWIFMGLIRLWIVARC